MPPVDPFVKAAVPGRGRGADVAATHGYLTPWIPPPSPEQGEMPHRPLMGQDHLACLPTVRVQSTPNCSRNAVTLSPMVGKKCAGSMVRVSSYPSILARTGSFSSAKTRLIHGR